MLTAERKQTSALVGFETRFFNLFHLILHKSRIKPGQDCHKTSMSGVREERPLLSSGRLRTYDDEEICIQDLAYGSEMRPSVTSTPK